MSSNSNFTRTTLNYPQLADTPIRRIKVNRAPTTTDFKGYTLGDEWLNTTNYSWYKLVSLQFQSATWVQFAKLGGDVETLTGNDSVAVGPDTNLNINLVGQAPLTVTGNAGTNTSTISMGQNAAFGAFVNTTVNNVTGAGAIYQPIFNTAYINNGGNYNTTTGIFTAPVTGVYCLGYNIMFTGAGPAHTKGQTNLNTSTQISQTNFNPANLVDTNVLFTYGQTGLYLMNATNTASVAVVVANGAQTVGVFGVAGPISYFFGWLISS